MRLFLGSLVLALGGVFLAAFGVEAHYLWTARPEPAVSLLNFFGHLFFEPLVSRMHFLLFLIGFVLWAVGRAMVRGRQ